MTNDNNCGGFVDNPDQLTAFSPSFFDLGMAVKHNMPCCVYYNLPDTKAVFDCSRGVFKPSWAAQADGWRLVKATTKFQKWIIKKFF